MSAGLGQTRFLDTTGWSLVVPLKPALNLAGFHLTARITGGFGGTVADLDSAVLVPGYGGAHEIDWTADANGLTDHLVLTVTPDKRGDWLAADASGRAAPVTVFADVLYTVAGSGRAPDTLGRTGFLVTPATNSPLVGYVGSSPVLIAGQIGQAATLPALQTGPQGPPGQQGPPGASADQTAPLFVAGSLLSGHMAVRAIGDGSVLYASADQPVQAGAVLGVTNGAAQLGAQVGVVTEGPIDEPSWSWLPGPVWLGLNGALTQSVPMSGMVVRIGLALSPTRLLVGVAPAILL